MVRTATSALYWCGKVVIDRRGDQLGKVLVCFDAVTIQHRPVESGGVMIAVSGGVMDDC